MSIESTNATNTAAARITTTNTTILPLAGMDDEEESTLVEISPSSSSSPPTMSSLSMSSRTSSTGTGDDIELHPKIVTNIVHESTTTELNETNIIVPSSDSSEVSTVALTEALTPEPLQRLQQKSQPPTLTATAQVATHHPIELPSRNLIPIQSSSSVSTPSSTEEYDESAIIITTEGALNVSSSNNQLNNNTAISHSELVAAQGSSIESVLPPSPSSMTTVVINTPESAPSVKKDGTTREAPLEIVQIFPPTETTLSSSSNSSSSSSTSSSASSTSTSSASSTSSSPSVSPLAVVQQSEQAKDTTSTKVQVEVVPKIDDPTSTSTKVGDGLRTEKLIEESSSWKQEILDQQQLLTSQNRSSSSSPQLQSSLKKEKLGEQPVSGENRRRVSFPHDTQLITGYLEPIDPWACVETVSVPELLNLYRKSCLKHSTEPLPVITEHLQTLDLTLGQRVPLLSLNNQNLSHGSCEALEEIFKRIQYQCINLSHAGLDDTSASVLFDMIEYYEATNELDISDNLSMTNKSWLACINMVKKCQALHVLVTRGPGISEHHAMNLAKALNTSALHTLKLEHCELSQRPLATLCNLLKRNTVLRELSLAHNQLTCEDAKNIANLLRSNYHIQLLDISNNNIGDKGVEYIVTALIEQSIYFKTMQETRRKSEFSFADLSSSLNSINNNKNYFSNQYGKASQVQRNQGMHFNSQQQQLQQKQQSLPKAASTSSKSSAVVVTPPTPPPLPLKDSTPITPPPTPALPIVRTPSDDVFISVTKSQSSKNEAQFSAEPMLQQKTAEVHKNEQKPSEVMSTNNDSGINCSVSSIEEHTVDETTISDVDASGSQTMHTPNDGKVQQNLTMVAPPTTPPLASAATEPDDKNVKISSPLVDSVTSSNDSENNQIKTTAVVDEHQECKTANVNETDSGGGRGIKDPEGGGEKQTLVLSFDLDREEDIKGSKKARLAKQDSVLSEFELSMPDSKNVNMLTVKTDTKPENVEHMEEDTPEVCEDYDDDASFKILEEHLLVDRSINANSCQQIEKPETKDHEEEEKTKSTDNDDNASIALLATFKKDELQLLLEKSKQQEERKEREPVQTVPLPVVNTRRTSDRVEENKMEDITSTSAPEKLESIPQKIIEAEIQSQPLSRSLDNAGAEDFGSAFLGADETPVFPNERSFSSESLNSETSVDSYDSKCSLKITESKFARNGTLERQQSIGNKYKQQADQPSATPCGLQVLVLWNNEITRNSAQTFADLIENTSTLEILNVGCNLLCNDFVATVKNSLKSNTSITSLGLQGAHLSDNGAKIMSEVIEFGGNSTLQRIDLRNNNILTNGLDYLNEALKSNKVVTRIDLDEVPRRAMENEVGPDYARLLGNVRAQCERNKHPAETTEPVSTAIKRVRATHLNSRKISLTCTSIRTSPSATASDKHHHHLLDPSKKPGGRLRSPLPSPIPSPIASPVPSPSRNRFQVTRVGESTGSNNSLTSINSNNNASTSPSPSSTGSSPTLFFAANSRFRVVTVEEPASSSSFVANPSQGKLSSSCNTPSPLIAPTVVSRVHPTTSSSAPALSSFVTLPKSTSSPIPHSIATNTTSPPMTMQHLRMQSPLQQYGQLPSPSLSAINNTQTPPTPKSKHTRLPSTSSTLNDSTLSSTSMESPDLEVKRFMSGVGALQPGTVTTPILSSTMDDSCCSSVSSVDSTDNAQFNNTSISSTDESFDLIVSPPTSSSISVGSISATPLVKVALSQQEDSTLNAQHQQQLQNQFHHQHIQQQLTKETPVLTNVNLLKIKNNSLSSLDTSHSSQESLYDVHELSSLSSCGGDSSLLAKGHKTGPSSSGNSNEGTLTSIQGLEKDKQATAVKPSEKPARVRKTSWIASLGNHPKTDGTSSMTASGTGGGSASSGYSPAIEKLLAIFSPSNLFSSNRSSPPSSECVIPVITPAGGKENVTSQLPSRKESPMGGLFQWTKSSKDEEKVLKVNISPENTITPQLVQQMTQFQQAPQIPTYSVENIPTQLKAEIKENISPENTITNKLLVTPTQSPQHVAPVLPPVPASAATTIVTSYPKVIFRLGDDYDESEDDIDTLTSKYGGGGGSGSSSGDFSKIPPQLSSTLLGTSTGSTGSTTTNSSGISISSGIAEAPSIPTGIMQTSHLGQIARDSLTSMFKNASLTSQDSIRSMDSLAEMTETAPKSQHHHHPHQQGPENTQPQ